MGTPEQVEELLNTCNGVIVLVLLAVMTHVSHLLVHAQTTPVSHHSPRTQVETIDCKVETQ